jgi:hypothetical protein
VVPSFTAAKSAPLSPRSAAGQNLGSPWHTKSGPSGISQKCGGDCRFCRSSMNERGDHRSGQRRMRLPESWQRRDYESRWSAHGAADCQIQRCLTRTLRRPNLGPTNRRLADSFTLDCTHGTKKAMHPRRGGLTKSHVCIVARSRANKNILKHFGTTLALLGRS